MVSRRKFIKQTAVTSAALCAGAKLLYAAAPNKFVYTSKFLRLEFDPNYPRLLDFDVDSLGKSAFHANPLLVDNALNSAGGFTCKISDKFSYYSKDNDEKAAWQIKCDGKKISMNSHYVDGVAATPLVINISQQINHSTVLGLMGDDNQVKFPCLLHLPGRGTFNVTCNQPDITLFYDAYRFQQKGETGEPYVKAEFKAADNFNKSITYTLEAVSICPDLPAIKNDPKFDGVRRDFINIFQLNPRQRVLANNSASDPCAFTLYFYAEMARRTPKLTDAFTAMDLVRESLNVYLGGKKAYGQVGYNNNGTTWQSVYDACDSAPSLIMAACCYILETNDLTWARRNYAGIKAWADKMIATDTNHDGFIEYGYSGNSGSWNQANFKKPANWWDDIGFGHDDAYSNALAYKAVTLLAQVAAAISKGDDGVSYDAFGLKLKSNYFDHFYNPATGILGGWRSADGKLHDYYFTFVNAVAVYYGLLTPLQGKQVMQKLLEKMKAVGYTNFKLGLPGNLIPIRAEDYADQTKRWGYGEKPDGSDGFQIYENGGATGCYCYFTIKALYGLGMRKEAGEILLPMIESFNEGAFEGHCEGSPYTRDWKTWTGECHGYEGFLVDNYLALLAVYDLS